MDRDAVLAKVIEVVDDTLSLGSDVQLNEGTNLKEDEFSMTFADDAVASISTIGQVVDAIAGAR